MQIYEFICKIRQHGNIFNCQFSSQRIGIVLVYMHADIGCHIFICLHKHLLLCAHIYFILFSFLYKLIVSCDILNGNSCRRFFTLQTDIWRFGTNSTTKADNRLHVCTKWHIGIVWQSAFCCNYLCNQYNISLIDSFSCCFYQLSCKYQEIVVNAAVWYIYSVEFTEILTDFHLLLLSETFHSHNWNEIDTKIAFILNKVSC